MYTDFLVHVNVILKLQKICTLIFGSCKRHSEVTEDMYTDFLVHVNVILKLQKICSLIFWFM